MIQQPFGPITLARFLLCLPFFVMLFMMLIEASLHAATTYLVIEAGRDVARGTFRLADLMWILASESTAYVIGALSWIFAERTGFLAYARYMLRFARDNRQKTKLLGDKEARERVEPFLTGETFYVYFHLLYEIEGDLRILLAIILNVIVLGTQIDGSLPIAYAAVFAALFLMQWTMRKRVASAYRENQRMTNRMTAQGYTAWDNVFAGNRYNLRLWLGGFKSKLRDGLDAQIRAIMTKEGLSAASGIVGLAIVFAAMAYIAVHNSTDLEVMIALAATLPRQIEMTHDIHTFTSGWNELLASWARMTGVADNMHPEADAEFDARMKLDRLVLREGGNASERHLARRRDGADPVAADRAHQRARRQRIGQIDAADHPESGGQDARLLLADGGPAGVPVLARAGRGRNRRGRRAAAAERRPRRPGFSSGERQLRALQEIVSHTAAAIYLLDEWDANLDPNNRAAADALVEQLARARPGGRDFAPGPDLKEIASC